MRAERGDRDHREQDPPPYLEPLTPFGAHDAVAQRAEHGAELERHDGRPEDIAQRDHGEPPERRGAKARERDGSQALRMKRRKASSSNTCMSPFFSCTQV